MKIQSFKRIVKENFPEKSRDIADAIGGSVNVFAEEVLNAFNKKITVDDNLNMEYKEVDVTVNEQGVPVNKTEYKVNLLGRIRGVSVIRADILSNSRAYLNGAPFITFSLNNDLVIIQHITGLVPGVKYRLTLLTLA